MTCRMSHSVRDLWPKFLMERSCRRVWRTRATRAWKVRRNRVHLAATKEGLYRISMVVPMSCSATYHETEKRPHHRRGGVPALLESSRGFAYACANSRRFPGAWPSLHDITVDHLSGCRKRHNLIRSVLN